jgi:AN1-like Zinc finger
MASLSISLRRKEARQSAESLDDGENGGDFGAGEHCQFPGCHQVDFLPFVCAPTTSAGGCGKTFCLEHRAASVHTCPGEPEKDRRAPACPLCGDPVTSTLDGSMQALSPNDAVEAHIAAGCRTGQEKRRKKSRCAQRGCRAVPVVPFRCDSCAGNYCAKHRTDMDHSCDDRRRRRQARAAESRTGSATSCSREVPQMGRGRGAVQHVGYVVVS